jgi:hypothetical protein
MPDRSEAYSGAHALQKAGLRRRTSTTVAAAENSAPEPCFSPLAQTGSRQSSDTSRQVTADTRQGLCVCHRRHDRHQDFRHEASRGDLLRADVFDLMGWRFDRRDVDRRSSGRIGRQRTAFPATAPEANDVKEAVHRENVGRRVK